jgi:hypothetical protein
MGMAGLGVTVAMFCKDEIALGPLVQSLFLEERLTWHKNSKTAASSVWIKIHD